VAIEIGFIIRRTKRLGDTPTSTSSNPERACRGALHIGYGIAVVAADRSGSCTACPGAGGHA